MAGRQRDDQHIYCFVPDDGINIVVLASYLKAYIDGTATIRPSRHPRDDEKLGFTVGASRTLGKEVLEDVIKDTRDWTTEQRTDEFLNSPYDYQESDTWAKRRKAGPSLAGERPRVVTDRRRQPSRHDVDHPRTFSDVSTSTQSTPQSLVLSRDPRSPLNDDSLAPSDSASQSYSYQRNPPSATRYSSVERPRYRPHPENVDLPRAMGSQRGSEGLTIQDEKNAGRDKRSQGRREKERGDPADAPVRKVPELLSRHAKPEEAY